MNVKKGVFLGVFIALIVIAFLQRDIIEIVYLKGDEVAFPAGVLNREKPQEDKVSVFIVGSEGTLQANLVEEVSKKCPHLSISTKVNRFTNFDWQEKNELHRFIREGKFDFVLIETAPVDFLKVNADRIARFESSARKSNSKIFYWSRVRPEKLPGNFLIDLPKDLNGLCPAVLR